MSRLLKWRYGGALAVLALIALGCSEATKNPAAPDVTMSPPDAPLFNGQSDIGQCMGDDAVSFPGNVSGFGTDPLAFNCTANDVRIANARTSSGTPIECAEGDHIFVDIVADVVETATSERTDIGIWVANGGGTSAEHGSCAFFYLPVGAGDPIEDLDGDQCGDLEDAATVSGFSLSSLDLICTDPDHDGKLVIPSCVSWTQPGGDRVCNADITGGRRAGTLPANKSKCNCEPFTVDIIIKGTLTIVKRVVNDNGGTATVTAFGVNTDAGLLTFDAGVADGANTLKYTSNTMALAAGSYTLRENDIAGYTEGTWSCTGATPSNNTIGAGAVTVPNGTTVVCTITNNDAQGSLTLVKRVVNDNGGIAVVGDFGITTDAGSLTFDAGAADGANTLKYTSNTIAVDAGSYTLRETDIAGYTEGTWSCTPTAASNSTISAGAVTVGNGVAETCTITNNDDVVISNGQILPTATTCEDYASGAGQDLETLLATLGKNFKITTVSPGVFFYYATVTKTGTQTIGFTQTINPNPASLPPYKVQQTQAFLYTYNGSSCTKVATLPLTGGGTAGSDGSSLPAGEYILGVKFATDAPKGTLIPEDLRDSGDLLATHRYQATVGGAGQATTNASVDTKTK